jgi:hypothetical protein
MRGLFAAAALLVGAQAIDPIVIKGQKFFYKTNGTQLYVLPLTTHSNRD